MNLTQMEPSESRMIHYLCLDIALGFSEYKFGISYRLCVLKVLKSNLVRTICTTSKEYTVNICEKFA
jgi:hypothetical protein